MGADAGALLSKRMSARKRCFELMLGFLIRLRMTCLKLAVLKLHSCSSSGVHPSFRDPGASVKYAGVPIGSSRGSKAIGVFVLELHTSKKAG